MSSMVKQNRSKTHLCLGMGLAILVVIMGGITLSYAVRTNNNPTNYLIGAWQLSGYTGKGCVPSPPKKLQFFENGMYESKQEGRQVTSGGQYSILDGDRLKLEGGEEWGRPIYILRFSVSDDDLIIVSQDCRATYRHEG